MELRINRSKALWALALVAALVIVVTQNRSQNPVDARNLATFIVTGLSLGGIYAVSAGGLVVTYSTTGIFNFAHGAIGCFLAFVYWELRVERHWAAPFALFVVIFVLAPALGLLLDVVLMRRLRNAALVVQLMVTVGLMLCFMGITLTRWKPNKGRNLPHFFESTKGVQIGDIIATWHRIITVLLALGIAIVLRFLLYRTRLGVAMRAVVDNRALAGLNGARPNLVSGASWALGCMTAAIAGILIAPETGMVVENLTLVIIVAFAAAAIGQLKSLPLTFVGGIVIGLAKAFTSQFLTFGKDYAYAHEAIPAVILFIAVLFLPKARIETGSLRLTRRTERLTKPWEAGVGAAAIVTVIYLWASGYIPWFSNMHFGKDRSDQWLGRGISAVVFGLIMMSLVPLIGWAGQVSFANFAIAGFGACMFAHFGGDTGQWWGLFVAAAICAPLGVVVALPALRLKGLYLALSTMAFAEIADKIIFRHPRVLDPVGQAGKGDLFKPLHIFGVTISNDSGHRKAFLMFLSITLALMFLGLELLRRTRWARRWIAMADSPAASATIGVNITITKIAVFALSGAMAGFAGALLGMQKGALQVDSFPLFAGLPLVLLLAVQGVRFPIAAFMGMLGLMSFPALYEATGKPGWLASIETIGPGIAALAMAYRPEGGVFYAGRDLAGLLPWRSDAREEKALDQAKLRESDIRRDEINDLGLTRRFSNEKVAQLDRVLAIADDVALPGGYGQWANGNGNGTGHGDGTNGSNGSKVEVAPHAAVDR